MGNTNSSTILITRKQRSTKNKKNRHVYTRNAPRYRIITRNKSMYSRTLKNLMINQPF